MEHGPAATASLCGRQPPGGRVCLHGRCEVNLATAAALSGFMGAGSPRSFSGDTNMRQATLKISGFLLALGLPLAVAVAAPPAAPAAPPSAEAQSPSPGEGHGERHHRRHGQGHDKRQGGGGPGAMFAMADQDGDAVVTRAEFEAMARSHFDKVDANHDGKVTREEADAARKVMAAAMGGRRQGRMEGAVAERLRSADKDSDGAISAEEAQALPMLAERFAKLDANGDGKLTREEMKAAQQRRR